MLVGVTALRGVESGKPLLIVIVNLTLFTFVTNST